jgi:hypothetical protein
MMTLQEQLEAIKGPDRLHDDTGDHSRYETGL